VTGRKTKRMSGRAAGDARFRRLLIDFHKGRVGRAEVAKFIHAHSTSISLKSLLRSLRALFPDAALNCSEGEVRVELLRATQGRMERTKYELVCLLFDEAETFDSYNAEFFDDHPVTAMHIGGARFAIVDGHHRVRRYAELTGGGLPMSVTIITSDSVDLIARFREEVEEVRREAGTSDVRELTLI
jgi:hypothetical protein